MELIHQHTKSIMEGCKERARKAGLSFQDESLEYIVTNRDLLELSPKLMIPTLYDYWVHDVQVLKEKGKYELYPTNPYETVINTRPPISFYNDNNPDWLNVMIFYHVLAHIDFFQNNLFFRHTRDYDFSGQALSDKRVIARLRSEKGRWVDYLIEFARGIDNIVGYYDEMSALTDGHGNGSSEMLDFYFDVFLQTIKNVKVAEYVKELDRYNACIKEHRDLGEKAFFRETLRNHPEFSAVFDRHTGSRKPRCVDLLEFLLEYSTYLNKDENKWMKSVLHIVRKTSLFFQPQIRTKIMNEGWASYWHERLFLEDDRIAGHEVDFARVHALVASMPRVGLDPYALGMRLFNHIEERGNRGKYSFEFLRISDAEKRKRYDTKTGRGRDMIFHVRQNMSDFLFINNYVDQDFISEHKLFVAGKRLNQNRRGWEYYVKSRKARDYRKMLMASLYHPPHITIDTEKTTDTCLYLVHRFEEKPLVRDYITNTMMGIEYLWGGPVKLETSEVVSVEQKKKQDFWLFPFPRMEEETEEVGIKWQKVLYTMEKRKLTRKAMSLHET